MKELLSQISKKAIQLADIEFSELQIQNKWLGNSPANLTEIDLAEKRLGLKLPLDYKKFLSITNGFKASTNIEPTFLDINKIDFLKNIDLETINIFSTDKELLKHKDSILVAGIDDEQYFLLIPPNSNSDKWDYWKFANWIPGEEKYNDLESYFKDVLEFINEEIP